MLNLRKLLTLFKIGKLARPKTGFLYFKEIKLLHVGLPITKDLVPSIGSMTHEKSLLFFYDQTPHLLFDDWEIFFISLLINFSKALSASVTGS